VANFSELLADEMTELLLDVNAFERKMARDIAGQLDLLSKEMERAIRAGDPGSTPSQFQRLKRTNRVIRNASKDIKKRYKRIDTQHEGGIREIAQFSRVEVPAIVNTALRLDWMNPLSVQRVRALADNQVILGGTAKEYWTKQSINLQSRFVREVRMGAIAGETNDQIVRRVRGRATGKRIAVRVRGKTKLVHEFTGGIMDVTTRDARTLVRTAIQNVSNEVYHQTYLANDDLVKGEQLIATLDSGTTPICMARDHGAWDLEGNPLPESTVNEPFPGPPPYHMKCRTIIVPLVKTWQDLEDEAAAMQGRRARNLQKQMDKVPAAGRSSIDGRIAADTTFDDFLKRKGDVWARKKLGPARYELWKKGKITLAQMVDRSGKTRTIEQLKRVRRPSKTVPVPS
jgi:hypothetical protein